MDVGQHAAQAAYAALRLQLDWGVDEALDPMPLDRLRTTVPLSDAAPSQGRKPPAPAASQRTAALARSADGAASAAAASGLDELRAAWAAFDGCALRTTAAHTILPTGEPGAGLVLLGDVPDADDDRAGQAFAGPTGIYLDRMLGSIGLARGGLRLAFLIPWRPPGGRPPSDAELQACLPFLQRYFVLAPPQRVVLFGNLAAKVMLGQLDTVRRARGRWREMALPGLPHPVPALATYAPSQVRSTARLRRDAWEDLLLLRRALDEDKVATVDRPI